MLALYTRISTELRSRLSRDEEGATAVEYGLIVGLIAVVLVAALFLFQGAITESFGNITDSLNSNNQVGSGAGAGGGSN